VALKQRCIERLGQEVRTLLCSINVMNSDVAAVDVRTKVMKCHVNVLGTWSCLVDCCNLKGSTVVFESAAVNLGVSRLAIEAMSFHFANKLHQRNDVPESRA
jgi:hypothetical protein